MAKQNYKRLGDYIQAVDNRNRDLQCSNLLGLSIAKKFIPSIANTIGTDLSTYKIVHNKQFAYVPVTSRNGDKITIALYDDKEDCIVSQAYTVFEIIDTKKLLPEYLMMWFQRSEFDRYARFKSIGSAREVFDWNEMCDVMIPFLSIEEQKGIVADYQSIESRITINKTIISKLEETAKSIFRNQFEMMKEDTIIPEGWRAATFGEFCNIFTGKKDVNQSLPVGRYRFYSCSADVFYSNEYISEGPAVIIAGNGYTGRTVFSQKPFDLYQRAYACVPRNEREKSLVYFLYAVAKFFFEPSCQDSSRGTTIQYIVRGDLENFAFTYNEEEALSFNSKMKDLLNYSFHLSEEVEKLQKHKDLMLSRLR